MIAAAFACAATLSYGAAANWSATATEICNGTATETYMTGTAFFFDANTTSQSALYSLFQSGTAIGTETAGYVGSATLASGSAACDFSYGTQGDGQTYSYYFAIVDGSEKIYLSNIVDAQSSASLAAKNVGFGDQYDYDAGNPPNSFALPLDSFAAGGHWIAAPEPTSGLLLLLGMAGLALKRKRA